MAIIGPAGELGCLVADTHCLRCARGPITALPRFRQKTHQLAHPTLFHSPSPHRFTFPLSAALPVTLLTLTHSSIHPISIVSS